MRVRTLVNRVVGIAALLYAGYAAISAGSNYLQVRGLIDQAVDEASRRPRTPAAIGQSTVALQEFASDTRTAILLGAPRLGFEIDPKKLLVEPRGKGTRVSFHWSHVLLVVAEEPVLAIPLWVDRAYELKP
jgi:hypothetical protein